MSLKTYQAYSMAEALGALKRDLGADAVILRTRSWRRGGFLGIGRRTVFEITASPAAATPEPAPAAAAALVARRPGGPDRRALRAYAPAAEPAPEPKDLAPGPDDRDAIRRLARDMLAKHEGRSPAPPALEDASPEAINAAMRRAIAAERRQATPRPAAGGTEPGKKMEAAPEASRPVRPAQRNAEAAARAAADPAALEQELAAIRTMVGEVLRRQDDRRGPAPGAEAMPPAVFDWYLRLVAQDVSQELAERIVREAEQAVGAGATEARLREAIRDRIAAVVPCAEQPIEADRPEGGPLVLALVGPTGVGKTTTLAKLAATFRLREGRKVGLVTADTYRIAAVEQLRTYADIISVPLKVARTSAEMRVAIESFADCDVVLVDTAGRSQKDAGRIAELREILEAARPHETHLVLSGTASERVLVSEAEAFGAVGVDRVVLTKLDEAVSFGVLVDAVNRIGKRLSWFTTGQEVPDHIEVGRPERLAELLMEHAGTGIAADAGTEVTA